MRIATGNRHRVPGWLRGSLGAAALAGLVSCAGGVDDVDVDVDRDFQTIDDKGDEFETKALPYEPGQILVRFKRDASISAQNSVHAELGTSVVHAYNYIPNLQVVELPKDLSVEEAVARFQKDPSVVYAEPNLVYQTTAVPDDTRFNELFGLHNTGQTGGIDDADIDAVEAWDITQGSEDVVIAVLDTGIDYNHPDLAPNAFVNPGEFGGTAGVDDDGNGFVDDIHGINVLNDSGDPFPGDGEAHGTHVSGTIAAAGNNGQGVVGVNWNAKLLNCKAFSPSGATLADIIVCLDYFLEMKTRATNPVNIIASNNSWGGGGFSQALLDAIEAHNTAGMLFIAAAGNSNVNTDVSPHFPSTYDAANIIAVLASNDLDERASFSNFGARTVDVGAPGQDILSTVIGGNFAVFSGTSMATPHVAGLVGLLKAADPTRTPQQLKNLVLTGGDVTPATDTEVLTGRRINAFGSLTCSNRILNNRFAPAGSSVVVAIGTPVQVGVLSINCDAPNSTGLSVRVAETGESIPLVDPSGSGQFTGQFTPSDLGTSTLEFISAGAVFDTVSVSAIASYDPPRLQPAECRTFEGTPLNAGDDSSVAVATPFPLQFAGATPGFDSVFVGSNGVLSFTSALTTFSNQALPSTLRSTIVAPFWDDLNAGPSGNGEVFHDVLGTAPSREFVIEWRDISHFSNVPSATFQVVFFENSPNILFNYCDVTFDNPSFTGGASATIGVQVADGVATQFSFNQASVQDGDALLFTQGAPIAAAGPNQVVLPGAAVTLDGSASLDLNGTIVSYEWTQTAGEPVDLLGADGPIATFTAPASSGTLTFQLLVTDDEGETGADSVDVIVNVPPVADAGEKIDVATNLVGTLDCSGSTDADGLVSGFQWTQLGGDPVVITGDGSAVATFVAPSTAQFMVFQCTVTDDLGFSDSDVVVAEVFFNAFPTANAGNDRIARPGSVVTLDGSRSSDTDGTIAAYSWQVTMCATVDGLCEITLSDAAVAAPSFTAPASPGFVQLALTVTDNVGASSSDTVIIYLALQPPVVVGSVDPECVSPGDLVTLNAAATDPDGTVVSVQWTQVAGPAVELTGADTETATFTAPATTEALVFDVTATDDDGLVAVATVVANVSALPVAVAVCAPVGVFEGGTVSCNGSGSENAVDFTWSSSSHPDLVIPPGVTTSFTAPQVDGFQIVDVELTASNECGATATDNVQIVVVSTN